jgi:D-3-phosphoglycerate dehydrogenase
VLFLIENRDRPGIVGYLGTLMGRHGINIAGMALNRDEAGGEALTILNLDTTPGPAVTEELLAEADIHSAQIVQL